MEFEKIQEIIADVLNVDPQDITMNSTFVDDLGADSLDIFQIIMGIEETFDIEIIYSLFHILFHSSIWNATNIHGENFDMLGCNVNTSSCA